ncbi:MAG: outer membrane protein assembly factor BamE [Comamonas sp.]
MWQSLGQLVDNHGGWLLAGLVALAAAVVLAGCDDRRIAKLEEGVSTEADVRAAMGEPERVWPEADGSQTLEYNRQPTGHRNFMITIGPQGRMTALVQVLTPERFALARPGMDESALRRLYGKPARVIPYVLKGETDWVWHYLEDGNRSHSFTASFGPDGRLLRTARTLDESNDVPDPR